MWQLCSAVFCSYIFLCHTAFGSVLMHQVLVASLLLCKHKTIPRSITYLTCAVDRLMQRALHLFSIFPLRYLVVRKWCHIFMQLR